MDRAESLADRNGHPPSPSTYKFLMKPPALASRACPYGILMKGLIEVTLSFDLGNIIDVIWEVH